MQGGAVGNLVGTRIATQLEPAAAASAVQPQLFVPAAGVVAQVDKRKPLDFGRIGRRSFHRCIAAVGEFGLVAWPAAGAGNEHHGEYAQSMGPGCGAGAFFVQQRALLKTLQ